MANETQPAPSFLSVVGVARPPFLLLTPAVLSLSLAVAMLQRKPDLLTAVLVFIAGLAAHVAVNALNEYHDFRSGLDLETLRTPFSGGSGTLPNRPDLAPAAMWLGRIAVAVVMVLGVWLSLRVGWELLAPGLAGLALILAYTGWITRQPLACLIAPGLGFGPLMLGGAAWVLAGEPTLAALAASLVVLPLVNNLLLLNQLPDIEVDRRFGRDHFPIRLGPAASARLFAAQMALAYVLMLLFVALGWLPVGALLGLLTLPLALISVTLALRHANETPRLLPAMGLNVAVNLLTPVAMAVGLMLL